MANEELLSRSIHGLNSLLLEITKKPDGWVDNAEFISVLKVQRDLASWECNERNIIHRSLNSLKKDANNFLDGGFESLDLSRINALSAIESEIAKKALPKKGSKAEMEVRISEQNKQISSLEYTNMLQTYLIKQLQTMVSKYAKQKNTKNTLASCKKELEIVQIKLNSLNVEGFLKKGVE